MFLDAQIESILFWKGEPVSIKRLAKLLQKDEADIEAALGELEKKLEGRGVTLVRKDDEVMLGTARENTKLIEELTKEELTRDLGKAGLETLSIVLYKGPISRREIDYTRGVNSTFILRNLLIRGLVEKVQSEKDQRMFLYKPTFELLTFMGLKKLEELPEYETVRKEVEAFEASEKEGEKEEEKQE